MIVGCACIYRCMYMYMYMYTYTYIYVYMYIHKFVGSPHAAPELRFTPGDCRPGKYEYKYTDTMFVCA